MREVEVEMTVSNAWETWDVSVPDDAPTDPVELKKWIIENIGDLDRQMAESGGDVYTITDVTEQEDGQRD